jgi:hypothetical protein
MSRGAVAGIGAVAASPAAGGASKDFLPEGRAPTAPAARAPRARPPHARHPKSLVDFTDHARDGRLPRAAMPGR